MIGGAIGVVAVAALIAVVLTLGSSGGPPEPAADALVITGEPLPALPAEGPDPAVGMTLPGLAGIGLDGEPMEIGPADGAQMVVVLHIGARTASVSSRCSST